MQSKFSTKIWLYKACYIAVIVFVICCIEAIGIIGFWYLRDVAWATVVWSVVEAAGPVLSYSRIVTSKRFTLLSTFIFRNLKPIEIMTYDGFHRDYNRAFKVNESWYMISRYINNIYLLLPDGRISEVNCVLHFQDGLKARRAVKTYVSADIDYLMWRPLDPSERTVFLLTYGSISSELD